jgi:hypothetical protein
VEERKKGDTNDRSSGIGDRLQHISHSLSNVWGRSGRAAGSGGRTPSPTTPQKTMGSPESTSRQTLGSYWESAASAESVLTRSGYRSSTVRGSPSMETCQYPGTAPSPGGSCNCRWDTRGLPRRSKSRKRTGSPHRQVGAFVHEHPRSVPRTLPPARVGYAPLRRQRGSSCRHCGVHLIRAAS